MSITLTPTQKQLLDRLIRTGHYSSAAEVLSAALHRVQVDKINLSSFNAHAFRSPSISVKANS